MSRQRILAVDSSNGSTSLAVLEQGQIVARADCDGADALGWLRRISLEITAAFGGSLASIDVFAVAHGPGALTGVRVGVGFVQGLALALDRPVVGVNTLATLALAVADRLAEPAAIQVALDARMQQLYALETTRTDLSALAAAPYAGRLCRAEVALAESRAQVFAGPGWEAHAEALGPQQQLLRGVRPHATLVGRIATQAQGVPATELQVHYLRQQVAQVPQRLQSAGTT